jgi:hypothetical protein
MKTSGILYIATGANYIHEAFRSARLSRKYALLIPFCLCTDSIELAESLNHDNTFTLIVPHPDPHYNYRDKILPLLNLPFELTLFLDTDAFLVESFDHFLDLVHPFHLAGCFAPVRHPPGWSDNTIPISFPEINTGVLVIKKSSQTTSFINRWIDLYDKLFVEYSQSWDQASFRSVLWHSIVNHKFSFYSLPSEFNLRTTKPWILGRGSPVFVVHGRFPDIELESFLLYINGDIDTFRCSSLWNAEYPNSIIRPRFDRTFD